MFSGGAYSDGPFSVPSQVVLTAASSSAAIAALVPGPVVTLRVQDGTAIGTQSTAGMFSGGAFSGFDEYTVFGTGPTSQASIAGLVPGPTAQVTATCGNEDVDIDATVPGPTVQMAVTCDPLGNKLVTIAGLVPGPVVSLQVTAMPDPITLLRGGSPKSLLNFAYRPKRKKDEPEAVDELPIAALEEVDTGPTPEQILQAQIAEHQRQQALHQHLQQVQAAYETMQARKTAMLHLLSQL